MADGGGGVNDTEGYGKISSKQLNSGAGFISDVILATEPRIGAVPE